MTDQLTEEHVDFTKQPVAPAPSRIPWAMVPRVNLLPMEIIEARQFRRTKVLLGAGVFSTVLVAVAGVLWAQQGVQQANDQLVVAQAKVTALNGEKSRYAEVPRVIAQVDEAKAARTLAMGADVLWYRYLNDLDGARPAGVVLNGLSLSLNSAAAIAAPPGDPLSSHGVGTVVAGGSAENYQQVASWLEALNKLSGISASTLGNATRTDETVVTFDSGAIIDTDALSHRYTKDGS